MVTSHAGITDEELGAVTGGEEVRVKVSIFVRLNNFTLSHSKLSLPTDKPEPNRKNNVKGNGTRIKSDDF